MFHRFSMSKKKLPGFNPEWYDRLVSKSNEKETLVKEVFEVIKEKEGKSCLEIGLGTKPYFAEKISHNFNRYVIVEKENSGGLIPENVDLIEKEWELVELEEKFDIILASHVVYYFKDKKIAIEKMFKHLTEKGRIIFVVNGKDSDYGNLKRAFAKIIKDRYDFTYDDIKKYLQGKHITEKTIASSVSFNSIDELYSTLQICFDNYPDEYCRYREKIIKSLKDIVKNNRFVVNQKILVVSPDSDIQKLRDDELKSVFYEQPYFVELDGLRLNVHRRVFPPDKGFTTRMLSRAIKSYRVTSALDMGCGSGYLALVMKKSGIPKVYAIDNHAPSIDCTIENVNLNPDLKPIEVIRSELFEKIPRNKKFDLIVFNHPFYPGTRDPLFRNSSNGGRDLVERFLSEARLFLSADGVILMSFSDMAGSEHDPKIIAEELGFRTKVILEEKEKGHTNFVYEIRGE